MGIGNRRDIGFSCPADLSQLHNYVARAPAVRCRVNHMPDLLPKYAGATAQIRNTMVVRSVDDAFVRRTDRALDPAGSPVLPNPRTTGPSEYFAVDTVSGPFGFVARCVLRPRKASPVLANE